MFDSVVFSHWPRGLYLAKKLSEKGRKVAYLELLPLQKSPFGLFVDESLREEKEFLNSLGFLSRQEGGFCLLSPEWVWPLQEMHAMRDCLPVLKNTQILDPSKNFKDGWLAYLALNMAGKVFEYNNSVFSKKNVNLFGDYFLFEPNAEKKKQMQENCPAISFYSVPLKEISFKAKEHIFFLQKKPLKAKEYFWLAPSKHLKDKKIPLPHWEWTAFYFHVDLEDYEEIIPSHFVSLKNIFLPWSHDNFLSVFYSKGQMEVWFRKPYKGKKECFLKRIKEHLQGFFKTCSFQYNEKESPKGPLVYGPGNLQTEGLNQNSNLIRENLNLFFQADLLNEVRSERELLKFL